MGILGAMDKVGRLVIITLFFLSPAAYAQHLNALSNIKNNPDGSQTLLNHVPKEVALGLASKTAHVDTNQTLDIRVILPSKDQAGLDSLIKDLYNPKSPSYHHFLTSQQFDQQFGASSVDTALIIEQLKAKGLTVVNQTSNGFIIELTGKVASVESAFKVNINNYKRTDGTVFFSPDGNPTLIPQLAGKVIAIAGMDNVKRLYPHNHRGNPLKSKSLIKAVNLPAKAASSPVALLNGVNVSNTGLKPHTSPPAAPTGLTAVASDNSVLLYWIASSSATSYNIYRSTSHSGPFTLVPTIDIYGNPSTISTTNFKDAFYTDSSIPDGLSNGTPYYYEVTAVGVGGEGADSTIANATPFAFEGIYGSMGPKDIKDVYYLNSVSSNGLGQSLGLYELDGYTPGDISKFESQYGLPSLAPTPVCTDEACPASAGSDSDEDILDIDLAIGVAPGLSSIRVYEAPNTGGATIQQWDTIVTDSHRPNVISTSWGGDESGAYNSSIHGYLSELATLGVSVFAAAGDSGAYDSCDSGTNPPNCTINGTPAGSVSPAVDYPASDPFVTGVGISILSVTNPGLSDETYSNEQASLYGGGGVSSIPSSMPSYQLTAATNYYNATSDAFGSTTTRNVPNVSFTADAATSYGIYLSRGCTTAPDCWYPVWGSSAAAPIWAAFTARVDEGRVNAGASVIGFLNPVIYQIAQTSKYANDFNDITTGINDSYPAFSGNDYYPAETGYDDTTGLGSFNGVNLYGDLLGPAAPTALSATPGNAQVMLSWTANTGDVSYAVQKSTTSGGPYTTVTTTGSTAYTDSGSGVVNSTTYYYVVSAFNLAGVEGANSSQANATPLAPPSAPTGVSATPGNLQISLAWTPSAHAASYNIYRATSPGGENLSSPTYSGVTAAAYLDNSGLSNGSPYYYKIIAVNVGGMSSASSEVTATPLLVLPSAPTSVNATAGVSYVSLSWASVVEANSYNIYRATTSGGENLTTPTYSGILTTSYSDTAVTNGQTYYYIIRAINGSGPSAGSTEVNAVPQAPFVAPPSNLKASILVARVGGHLIYGATSLSWAQSTTSGVTQNRIYRSINGGAYSTYATVSATTSYLDKSTQKGITYYYKVTAISNAGESLPSNVVSDGY